MSLRRNNDAQPLPLDVVRTIDALCDEFESAIAAGDLLPLEPLLDRVPPVGRRPLLEELVAMAVYGRRDQQRTRVRLLAENPELAAELRSVFDKEDATILQAADDPSGQGSRGLSVRCPHCHIPILLSPDAELESIECPSCGSDFSLVGDADATRAATTVSEVGHFKLVERVGMGAFGSVWKAHDTRLDRTVAVKLPRKGQFDEKQEKAFLREAQNAAQLNHPGIVPVHEVGRDGDTLYIVSDFVRGITLSDWLTGQQPSFRESAELVIKIAEALNHAHERGVVHRDLKPGNIMLDSDLEPHLMDFGLARREAGELTMSLDGQVLGTPAYMSPEQAEGDAHNADRRSDIYSLGVMLYQLLTGELPFRGNARMLLYQVIHDEPPSPRKLNASIPRDLETITLKCMQKARDRRYPTAGDLARDIGHYLVGDPIEAKRDSTWYVLGKNIVRYRAPVAVATGFVLMLAIGLIVSLALWRRATTERDRAVQAERLAHDRERATQLAHAEGVIEEATALHIAGHGQESRAAFQRARDMLGELSQSTLSTDPRLQLLFRETDAGLYRSLREFEAPINTLHGHSDGLMAVDWLPDDVHACSASEDGTVRLWDARTGRQWGPILRGHAGAVNTVAVSPDGESILSGGLDGSIRRWRMETGEEMQPPLFEPAGDVRGVAFSSDGRFALSGSANRGSTVKLWNLRSGQRIRDFATPGNEACYGVAFDPSGRRVLATTYEHSVWIWDTETAEVLQELSGHKSYVISAKFSPDGDRVLSASFDRTLKLWDAQTGSLITTLKGHTAGVRGVAFINDDSAISCSMDGTLKIWDLATGEAIRTFAGHEDGVRGLAISSDGQRAISAGIDGTLMVWNLAANAEAPAVNEEETVTSLACSEDGRTFVSGDAAGSVKLRDLATFQVLRTFDGHLQPIDTARILPEGRRVFGADSTGECRVWDIHGGHELFHRDGHGPGEDRNLRGGAWCYTAVSPDGRLVLSSKPDGTMVVRNMESKKIDHLLPAASDTSITCVAISPDSKHAVSGDEGNRLHYWDIEKGQHLSSTPAPSKMASLDCVVFSADGKRALSGGHDLIVRLWDLTGDPIRLVREYVGATLVVEAVGFGRGERTLYSVGRDQTFRMWDAENTRELYLPALFPKSCYALAVVPPGDSVLIGSGRSVIHWNIPRFQRYEEFAYQLSASVAAPGSRSDDATAQRTLGEWYAFRGVNDWAVQLLEEAAGNGADISSLTMARCYWKLGRLADAAREFRSAIADREAPTDYLNLCLAAVMAADN